MGSPAQRAFAVIVVAVVGLVGWGVDEVSVGRGDHAAAGRFGAILAFVVAGGMVLLGVEAWRRLHPPAWSRSVAPLASFARPAGARPATLVVERPRPAASDLFRVYRVEVDRRHVADLRIGQSVEVDLPAGEHTVGARLADNTAPPLTLVLRPEETARVRVQPTAGGAAQRRSSGWLVLTTDPSPAPGVGR